MLKLNAEQHQAVEHFEGPCVVTSIPGSGKTRILTERVCKLIERGIDPSNLLCVTFTNKAANEMKERVAKRVGQQSDKVWISTFHSLFIAVLRKYGSLVKLAPNFSIYDDSDQRELIEKIGRMHEFSTNSAGIYKIAKAVNDYREDIVDFDQHFTILKPVEVAIVKEYLQTLDDFNAVDFSGILQKAYLLFCEHPKVADALSKKFAFVLGDEWQDTNTIQYEAIKKIASHGNLFIVGDTQQSVFGFRGAKPENMQKIKHDFQNTKEIILTSNYRSTSKILAAAESLIRHNDDGKNVTLVSVKGDGHPVSIHKFYNSEQEAHGIANAINDIKSQYGYEWKDFAILYRTNILSKVPEMVLRQHGIPYKIYGGFSFFDRSEIKTSLAYLAFLANPNDTVAFARAIQNPKRSIGTALIGKLERLCQKHKISILDACKKADFINNVSGVARQNLDEFVQLYDRYRTYGGMPISKLASGLLKDSGYYDYMKHESEKDDDSRKRVENIDELLVSIADFEIQKPYAKLSEYLHSVDILTSDIIEQEDNSVGLMTMHSSKGLEFEVVFIIGCEQGLIPHSSAVREGNINEEKRLFYVAITRSMSNLFISYCATRKSFSQYKQKNVERSCEPSPFLSELGIGFEYNNNNKHSTAV